jgi:hypothetical protein
MISKPRIIYSFILLAILAFGLAACDLQAVQNSNQPDLAATITAQALLLQTLNSPPASANTPDLPGTITAQALALQAPGSTPVPAYTLTPAFTATPSAPEVSVTVSTNCRTGPGSAYDVVWGLNPGQTAQLVGQYTPDNYWIINNPSGGTCWLWGQYAVVSGNTATLPEYTPPPTPTPAATSTPSLPAAPTDVSIAKMCPPAGFGLYVYSGILGWKDMANNAKGYKVYVNGTLLATLPPNSTTFPVNVGVLPQGQVIPMGVLAFNDAGASSKQTTSMSCP